MSEIDTDQELADAVREAIQKLESSGCSSGRENTIVKQLGHAIGWHLSRYEGCLTTNRAQVTRLATQSVEIDMLRAKDELQRKKIAELNARIVDLTQPASTP